MDNNKKIKEEEEEEINFQTLLRKKIQEIQLDNSLTTQEKSKKIQLLLRNNNKQNLISNNNKKSNNNKNEELNKTISYFDQEKKIFGCKHYQRGAKIKAFCCNQLFGCRFCHDEIVKDHEINRYQIEEMMCFYCSMIQPISQQCNYCNQKIAKYYCNICKLLDDDPKKNIFHCNDCGLCRVGKKEEYFHCKNCDICLSINLKDNHKCIEKILKQNCPICSENMFTSKISCIFMKCGHPIHSKCYQKSLQKNIFFCPVCSKSTVDMSEEWKLLDSLILSQPMPPCFEKTIAFIFCNDCENKASTKYHFLGLKCNNCGSYNTKEISTSGMPDISELQKLSQ